MLGKTELELRDKKEYLRRLSHNYRGAMTVLGFMLFFTVLFGALYLLEFAGGTEIYLVMWVLLNLILLVPYVIYIMRTADLLLLPSHYLLATTGILIPFFMLASFSILSRASLRLQMENDLSGTFGN